MPLSLKTFILSSIFLSRLLSCSNQNKSKSSTDFFQFHLSRYLASSCFKSAFPTRHSWNSFLKNGSTFSTGTPNSCEKRWLKYISRRTTIPSVSNMTVFIIRCLGPGSNRRPPPLRGDALPTELPKHYFVVSAESRRFCRDPDRCVRRGYPSMHALNKPHVRQKASYHSARLHSTELSLRGSAAVK